MKSTARGLTPRKQKRDGREMTNALGEGEVLFAKCQRKALKIAPGTMQFRQSGTVHFRTARLRNLKKTEELWFKYARLTPRLVSSCLALAWRSSCLPALRECTDTTQAEVRHQDAIRAQDEAHISALPFLSPPGRHLNFCTEDACLKDTASVLDTASLLTRCFIRLYISHKDFNTSSKS